MLNHKAPLRNVNVYTWCLLALSAMLSVISFQLESLGRVLPIIRIVISPLLHADYLHLCVNTLGGFLVLSRLEETNGLRLTSAILTAAYVVHVILVAFCVFVLRLPLDVLGLSSIVFAGLGFFVHQIHRDLSKVQKNAFVSSIVLMVIFEVSVQTILVHCFALMFGFMLAFLSGKGRESN